MSGKNIMNRETSAVPSTIPANQVTPMHMLQMAMEQGADLDKMEKLMELERRWKNDKAREAFNQALTAFKSKPVLVTKDKQNLQYGSKYTSLGNMVNTVNAAMAPYGLSARWEIDQKEAITVTCILSHTLGHSERVSMSGPADESGKKNRLQQIKSTVTYLKASTFEAVTGVVSSDHDDDGNGAVDYISEEQEVSLTALMEEVGADKAAFLRYCKVESLESLPANKFKQAVAALEAKRAK